MPAIGCKLQAISLYPSRVVPALLATIHGIEADELARALALYGDLQFVSSFTIYYYERLI